jgi:periplasmic mercuric ion binding protein
MRRFTLPAFAILASLFVAASLQAETKVTISKTHLCCPMCVTAVAATLKDVDGVKHKCSQEAKTIEITADSEEAAQKAIDALAKAGFYGATDSEKVKYKLAEAPQGDVERLEIIGVHNCCGACTQAIKKALGTVDGITANTVKAKSDSFVLEGKFSAEKAIKALLDAGFCAQVKK